MHIFLRKRREFLQVIILNQSIHRDTKINCLSSVNRFRLDDSRISNASPETGTKDDNDVNIGHADISIYPEEENFEWKEVTRGWIITPCSITKLGILITL